MKKIIQVLLILVITVPVLGQLEWANSTGASSQDAGAAVAVDNNDNIILTGRFRETVDFDFGAGTTNLTSNGSDDLFIAKYDQNENLIWAISMGGANSDRVNDVAVDDNGDIYITGRFQSNSIDMDPGPGTAEIFANSGTNQWDIFVAKYSANGDYLWAFAYGTPNIAEAGNGIDVDNNGDVYVTGIFRDPIDFDPGPGTALLTPNSNGDIFVAKYNTNGDYIWAFNLGASGFDTSAGQAIKADNQGNVYVAGDFEGTVDFDPGTGTTALSGNSLIEGFLAKYNENGDFEWVVGLISGNQNRVHDIEIDPVTGDPFIAGYFTATVDFDPLGSGNSLSSNTGLSPFIARYNTNGTLNWVKQFAGSGSSARSLTLSGDGTIWCTGTLGNTVDFDPPNAVEFTPNGTQDIFVGQYNATNGDYICAYPFGVTGLNEGSSIVTNSNNNAIFTGYFEGSVDFDPGPGTVTLNSAGSLDIPLVKLNNICPSAAPTIEANFTASETEICVGDTITFTDNSTGTITSWAWDFDGADPATENTQGPHEVIFNTAGTYTIELEIGDGIVTDIETLSILVNALPSVDAGADETICLGDTVELNATGADVYFWDNGIGAGATHEVEPTSTTVFTVTGTDNATGCVNEDEIEVTVNPLPSIDISADEEVCEGETLNLEETNGHSSYEWSGPDNFTSTAQSPTVSNMQSPNEGWYVVEAEDANSCSNKDSVFVQVLPPAFGTDVQVSCDDFTWIDGVTYTSSTSTPTFTISGGAANGCDSTVTLDLTITSAVTGTDVQVACEEFTWIDGITYTSSTTTPEFTIVGGSVNGCDSIVTLDLTINQNVTGVDNQVACGEFTWIDGNTYTESTNTPEFIISAGAANGCDSIVTLDLTIEPAPNVDASSNSPICEGDSLFLTATDISGASYNWTGPQGFQTSAQNPSIANTVVEQSGEYQVVMSLGANCNDTATVEVEILIPEYDLIVIDDSCETSTGSIIIDPFNPGASFTYQWDDGSEENSLTGLDAGNYSVTIIDENNCSAFEEIQLFNLVDDCACFVYVPNAFSPNGDNNNDEIFVRGDCVQSLSFKIFNRWGNMVFETNQLLDGWDGKYNGQLQNSGVFVYMLEVTYDNGETEKESGDITLIR